jgi:predicted DNA-binding transcriptional regulator AlpA
MKSKIAPLNKSFISEGSTLEAGQAVKHLIDIVKQIRSECAAMATYVVEIHAIDLRSLFLALHKVEEFGIDRPIPKPVYKRSEVLQITGWSRTTLWRKCDDIGLPSRKKAFTQTELEKLVQWDSD